MSWSNRLLASTARATHRALHSDHSAVLSLNPCRSLSTSSSSSSSSSSALSTGFIPATSIAAVSRPGGRSSVSGIVATVFGASGFVGRYIVNNLGRIGSQVIVPYRGDGMNVRHLKLSGDLGQIVPIPFDLKDASTVEKAVCRSNVVVNSLGAHYPTGNFSYDDVNVKLTYRIAKSAKEAGVERFIHLSCLGASPTSSSAYFRSKAEGEAVVQSFFPDATILRPAPIFGLEDHFINYYCRMAERYVSIPVVNGGQTQVQPVAVQDVARAVLACITYFETMGQTYHLAGPTVYTYHDIIRLCEQHLHFGRLYTTNLPPSIARWYGRVLSGDRPFKNVTENTAMWFPYLPFIGKVLDKLRMPNVYHEDMAAQQVYDLIQPPNSVGLRDLNLQPTTLESKIGEIALGWRKLGEEEDGGGRFEHVGERGPTTRPLE